MIRELVLWENTNNEAVLNRAKVIEDYRRKTSPLNPLSMNGEGTFFSSPSLFMERGLFPLLPPPLHLWRGGRGVRLISPATPMYPPKNRILPSRFGSFPLIWKRRFGNGYAVALLDQLHTVIQETMGWMDYHLHPIALLRQKA
ncbi:hypothetical protein D5085_04275 [Ectothiorhodospiraceae bacterium BW-2]|nr:hypothetical protein D5085_04275 [Ectothiorhodospiraceae bacterium BW-2]